MDTKQDTPRQSASDKHSNETKAKARKKARNCRAYRRAITRRARQIERFDRENPFTNFSSEDESSMSPESSTKDPEIKSILKRKSHYQQQVSETLQTWRFKADGKTQVVQSDSQGTDYEDLDSENLRRQAEDEMIERIKAREKTRKAEMKNDSDSDTLTGDTDDDNDSLDFEQQVTKNQISKCVMIKPLGTTMATKAEPDDHDNAEARSINEGPDTMSSKNVAVSRPTSRAYGSERETESDAEDAKNMMAGFRHSRAYGNEKETESDAEDAKNMMAGMRDCRNGTGRSERMREPATNYDSDKVVVVNGKMLMKKHHKVQDRPEPKWHLKPEQTTDNKDDENGITKVCANEVSTRVSKGP